jgi:tubulin-specific chaperone D
MLKQGVERLDNVRQEVGANIIRLLLLPQPAVAGSELWRIHGDELMKELFLR